MKNFIKTIIVFFIPLVCFFLGLEYGMRIIPNTYSYKNSWLENNIDKVHIWIFGSSHSFDGINPNLFSKYSFNSAHSSQTILFDKFIFDKFIDRADSLEWIILPVSYFTLTEIMEDNGEWWRIKNYCLYYNCPYYDGDLIYHSEILGNPLPIYKQVARVGKYLICGENDVLCDSLGWKSEHSDDRDPKNWIEDGKYRAKLHTKNISKNQQIIQQNRNDIEYMIEKCAQKNVSVLLITTPVYHTYYECIDSTQYTITTQACENWVQKYNHVYYLNCFKDSRFVEEDFHNVDHLDKQGALKLTKIINNFLISIQNGTF